jgi:aminoglycoside phosphotransferase (APT) family kinase protein
MTPSWLDQPAAPRPGELPSLARLEPYLRRVLPAFSGPLTIEQFPQGFSNLTYLLRLGDQELVLRRPPIGTAIRSAHDMGREVTILSRLVEILPIVPRPVHYCQDETVLGAPFYLMTRLRGVILRGEMPAAMRPAPALMSQIAGSAVAGLAALHLVDYRAAGLAGLGRPEGYVRRQVEGWSDRYLRVRTDDLPPMERTARWLAERQPADSGAALVHNDYKYDNLLLDPADWSQIAGVLDWEMATIGDPLMDLGTTLGYWVQADDPAELQALRLSPTTLPGNPSREEVVERYGRLLGREVPDALFYYVYGLFKLGVIVQQIYARYRQGYTQDPRFAGLIGAVAACGRMAERAIARRRLDGLGE